VLRRTLAAALLLGALIAAPAQAAPKWLPPFELTQEGLSEPYIGVAVAPDGTTVATWSRSEGSGLVVEAARRLPGQAFGPPMLLSDPDNDATAPQVAIDGAGNATVAWQETDPVAPLRVRAARLPAGAGAFEQAQTLSSGAVAFAPAIGVGSSGTAVVIFGQGPPGSTVMKAAIRDGAGGVFGLAQTISDASDNFYATNHTSVGDVVVAPDGSAVAAWATLGGGRYLLQTNERAPNGTFSPTGTTRSPTSANASGEQPTATIDPSGRVTVAWTQVADNTNPSSPKEIRSITRPPGGGFGSFAVASEPGVSADAPDLAAAADGTVIGAWVTGTGSDRHVEAAIRAPGATGFGQHAPLSPAGTGFAEPTVAANARGDAIVLWPDFDTSAIVAARRPAGSTFGAPLEPVNDSGEPSGTQFIFNNAALAIDDQGNGTAFWRFDHFRSGSHFYRVQAAGFDAAPPTLAASVPPATIAGTPVAMAAAALDRWGPVSLSWAFGDGAAGAGGAVSHAFGAAGVFNVHVTATDAAGNATTATRAVTVAAAPLPRILSTVASSWGFDRRKRYIFLLRLRVKAPPKGAVAELRCAGRRCPLRRKRVARIRRNRIDVFKALSKRQRRFRPGQRLQLRITAPGHIGKVVKFRLRRGRIPTGRTFCLPPGATRPRKTC
jgi:hypothetical protein